MKKFTLLFLSLIVFAATQSFGQMNLGDLIWNDANGNGQKDVYEHAIGGVTVKLYADNDGNNVPDGPGFGTILATTTSDANGIYSFSNLTPGRYIASMIIPEGYTLSPSFSATPDDNIDNDNNAAVAFNNQSEIRSNAITLTQFGEPENDGDNNKGNRTLDLAVCGRTNIGDFVWYDRNGNGLQEADETGIANAGVTLTFPDGTTYKKFTDALGKYVFYNLGPGAHSLSFETPVGFLPSPALVGGNRSIDSDPVGGVINFNVLPNSDNYTYDAGFHIKTCTVGNCGAGFIQVGGTCVRDTDGDCVADEEDLDDDNDGIIDEVENNGYNALEDCDSDGILNFRDPTPGCPLRSGDDIYGNTFVLLVWTDCNSDGVNDFFDWDRDGIINELDLDSDNDGILDIQEARDIRAIDNNIDGMADGVDDDNDGIMSTADLNDNVPGGPGLTPQDLDRDGLPNYLDLDSDGDGIVDVTEALLLVDSDGLTNGTDTDKDGVLSVTFSNNATSADNFNGFGAKGIQLIDIDADGYPNPYDIDSDNDGITDNVEAQPTCIEVQPFGVDVDGDGLDDAYDTNLNACRRNAHGITPYDKDGDGTPDMYDEDTDNDGAPDFNEGSGISGDFVTDYNDTDEDGLIDQFDIFNIKTASSNFINNVAHSNMGPNGSFDGPVPAGSNAQLPQQAAGDCSTGADRDWRDITVLPVNMVSFKAVLNGSLVNLVWSTSNEVNMRHYVVERSTDGTRFYAVKNVLAKGSILSNNYSSIDDVAGVTNKTIFYRLQQVDKNGQSKASEIVSVKLVRGNISLMQVVPNPVRTQFVLKVNVEKDAQASVKITDMMGRPVLNRAISLMKGINNLNFSDLPRLSPGTYTISLNVKGEITTQKLVVIR